MYKGPGKHILMLSITTCHRALDILGYYQQTCKGFGF